MNRAITVCLLISVIANVFLLYRLLDTGVTTTYEASQIKSSTRQLSDMQKLFPGLMTALTRDALMNAARTAGLEVIEKDKSELYVGTIEFSLADNKVVGIHFD
jgi:hypothetical protein